MERKGLRCTHVDALRFFAPAAAPLNHHGSFLEREDQLRLVSFKLSYIYSSYVMCTVRLSFLNQC